MKELKDYIHLYIGCKIADTNNDAWVLAGVTESELEPGKTIAICKLTEPYDNQVFYEFYVEDIKLILRPHELMTNDEKVELAHIIGGVDHLSVDAKIAQVTELMSRFYNMQTNIPAIKWMHACRYFCSIGMDIFNLKDAGLAVYETDKA